MIIKRISVLILIVTTWTIVILHLSIVSHPSHDLARESVIKKSNWIDKSVMGIHQLVLFGNPYEIGVASGRLAKPLLIKQEDELFKLLNHLFPNFISLKLFQVALGRWYWGIDQYFEPWALEEMLGVSESAPKEFDFLADGLTRQVAYHGLHEVGQMMVDQKGDDFGCTVFALPKNKSWIVGRNFDFDASRIFDEEKIMKWVFPDNANSYLSIIWAGMVGAVTGVNEYGIFISMNAAGSMDFNRQGTPSTLVLTKVLRNARTAEDAIQIIKESKMFITDIFAVVDSNSGKAYRVEKSPKQFSTIEMTKPSVITNHLISPQWIEDKINVFRRDELTSKIRENRGLELLLKLNNSPPSEKLMLSLLRDKGQMNGKQLHLGNRQAIDPLIATHSVIFDGIKNIFWVSQGPSLSGKFLGFDLKQSFMQHRPIRISNQLDLPDDPLVTLQKYQNIKAATKELKLANNSDCNKRKKHLDMAILLDPDSSAMAFATGDWKLKCLKNSDAAILDWKLALDRFPAYPKEIRLLNERLLKAEQK